MNLLDSTVGTIADEYRGTTSGIDRVPVQRIEVFIDDMPKCLVHKVKDSVTRDYQNYIYVRLIGYVDVRQQPFGLPDMLQDR